jgi:hypothetical protein
MSHCKTVYRLVVAALATIALAAPTAFAMPFGSGPMGADLRQQDMHASTVQAPVARQDQRTPDAVDQSTPKAAPVHQDQRSPDAVDQTRPQPAPVGMPTWPAHPEPLTPPKEPTVLPTGGNGGGVDWTLPAIALAGCLMFGGALVAARTRLRSA